MAKEQRELAVRVLVEADENYIDRTTGYVKSALKSSCRNLVYGAAVLALYDEHGKLVGLDITGTPTDELAEIADELFPEDSLEVPPVAPPTHREGEAS